jgi:hypothetical protein
MFNCLDRPFELLNLKYEREVQKILCFAKHHSITHKYIYIYIYMTIRKKNSDKWTMNVSIDQQVFREIDLFNFEPFFFFKKLSQHLTTNNRSSTNDDES